MKRLFLFILIVLSTQILAKEKIVVTGGAGFIGSHVAAALLARGDTVIIIDNLNNYYDPKIKRYNLSCVEQKAQEGQLRFYKVDICDKHKLEDIFKQEQPTSICHLAAKAGVRASVNDPASYLTANILGTLNILEMAKQHNIQHLVIASSSSVYGKNSDVPFEESSSADRPCSPYAATKRAIELLAHVYHHLYDLSVTCLRFFTVYGPRGRPDMAPFKFLDAISQGKPITQYGSEQRMRDFTYIDDIVDGVIRALDTPLGYEIINLGTSVPINLKVFIQTIEEVVGKRAHIKRARVPVGDVDVTHADITKARNLLGYEPKVSLREGMQRMFAWYCADINE